MKSAFVRSIACALPEREVSNADLERENPSWGMEQVARRTGVVSRRVAEPDETAFDLSVRACESLVADSDLDLGTVDAIVYCTQTPDYMIPGNALLLHRQLGLSDDVLAFDYRLACSGYVYGLGLAESFVRSGLASEILLVTADTLTKSVNPDDRATRALFGDGAAVTHIGRQADLGARITGCELRSHGQAAEAVYARPTGSIEMNGGAVWSFVNSTVPAHVTGFLAAHSLTLEDIDLCVFHQASGMTLDSLARALSVDRSKLYTHLRDVGNLIAASIPVALRAAIDEGAIQPGDRVLLTGYGAGASYGSVLVEF